MGPGTSLNVTGHWNPGIGRINVIAREPGNPQTLYIGSPSGGLWKTTDEGANWMPLTDNQPILGVSAVAINPTNTDIVYGTSQFGNFYKSNNGGNYGSVSISQPGGGNWVTSFVIHPTDPAILFVGNSEVRKTTDGMNSWTTISNFNIGDLNNLAIAESNGDYLYASKGSKIYRTKNGGNSWASISNVKIMFESYCNYGNNLYIDNILISNNVDITKISTDNFQVDIVPNPSSGIFNISVKEVNGSINLKLVNSYGQLLLSDIITDVAGTYVKQIDLSNQSKGIYFVIIKTGEGAEVRKILIK